MWIFEVSRNGREILRQPIQGRSLLIGRSPSCDVVLRSPGIKPVHFLLEWIGEGAPIPGDVDWSLSDIHKEDGDGRDTTSVSNDESGMGILLSKEPITLSGYEFRWVFDSLAETSLQKGVLSEKLRQAKDGESDAAVFFSDSQILEVVTVNSQRNKVTDIQHFKLAPYSKGFSGLPLEPPILFHTPMEARAHVDLHLIPDAKAYLRGYVIRSDDLKETVLGPNDLLQVRWQMNDYYLRMVPEVRAPHSSNRFWKEPFYQACMGALGGLALLIALVSGLSREEELKEVVPPRIAQVSIREMLPALPPAPEPAPMPVDRQEPEPLPPADSRLNIPQARPRQSEAVAPQANKAPNAPVPGKQAPVSSMGLLGNLKATKEAPRVRADKVLNQGLQAENAAGDDGFVMKQVPAGQIARKERGRLDTLAAAASEVKANTRGEVNTLGNMRPDDELPPEAKRLGSQSERARAEGLGDTVTGGLTRASVKQSIRVYQKEIRSCYEKALLVKPKISGRIVYNFMITSTGKTSRLRMVSSQVGTPSLEKCVFNVLTGIEWPQPKNGQVTTVNYPFEFTPR